MVYRGPRLVYKFRADAAYYRTIIDRYYAQRALALRLPVQLGLVSFAIVGAGLMYRGLFTRTAVGIGVAAALLLTWSLVAMRKRIVLYRFEHRADFGAEVTMTLSKEAIISSGRRAAGQWGWQAYPRSVRYADGILLRRRGVMRWLPDSALQEGTPADATALVREKTAMKIVGVPQVG